MSCDIISLLHIVTFNNLFFNRYSLLKRMHCLCHSSANIRYSLSSINILTKKNTRDITPKCLSDFLFRYGPIIRSDFPVKSRSYLCHKFSNQFIDNGSFCLALYLGHQLFHDPAFILGSSFFNAKVI